MSFSLLLREKSKKCPLKGQRKHPERQNPRSWSPHRLMGRLWKATQALGTPVPFGGWGRDICLSLCCDDAVKHCFEGIL